MAPPLHHRARQPVRFAFLLLAAAFLSACIAERTTGVRIGDETLKQFEAGTTTEAWLVAILGEPTESSPVTGIPNTKVFRYSLVETNSGLFSLFSGQKNHNTSTVYFILTDGIVTRFWADRETKTTLLGKPIEETGGQKKEEP